MRSLTFFRIMEKGSVVFYLQMEKTGISVVRFRENTNFGHTVYTYVLLNDSRGKKSRVDLSHDMRFPTKWYVRPAKPQISLRICAG